LRVEQVNQAGIWVTSIERPAVQLPLDTLQMLTTTSRDYFVFENRNPERLYQRCSLSRNRTSDSSQSNRGVLTTILRGLEQAKFCGGINTNYTIGLGYIPKAEACSRKENCQAPLDGFLDRHM
jgi:hypothetical protein